ncbi:MAG: helicase-related protein, partial [Nanoarchaeota archaeon]
VIDECHRSKEHYANTIVASQYMEQAEYPRILALTASPGSTKEKIQEICKNLYVEDVEVRTEQDEDVAPYIQKKDIEHVKVDLPPEMAKASKIIEEVYREKVGMLRSFGMTKPQSLINKRDILLMQIHFQGELRRGNKRSFAALSLIAQAIKLGYLIELWETQSTHAAEKYLEKLAQETSKAAKTILNNSKIQAFKIKMNELKAITHPKLLKTKEIVQQTLEKDANAKIIIFANYRSTVDELKELISQIPLAKPTILVGQKLGFTQKEQLSIIEKFNKDVFNILIGTSITEEGLSIGSLDCAIFYDHTGSEIRKIQRSGRVGRIKPGKVIYIVAKGTRDEGLLWSSVRKEQKMHNILRGMKQKIEKQQTLPVKK